VILGALSDFSDGKLMDDDDQSGFQHGESWEEPDDVDFLLGECCSTWQCLAPY